MRVIISRLFLTRHDQLVAVLVLCFWSSPQLLHWLLESPDLSVDLLDRLVLVLPCGSRWVLDLAERLGLTVGMHSFASIRGLLSFECNLLRDRFGPLVDWHGVPLRNRLADIARLWLFVLRRHDDIFTASSRAAYELFHSLNLRRDCMLVRVGSWTYVIFHLAVARLAIFYLFDLWLLQIITNKVHDY